MVPVHDREGEADEEGRGRERDGDMTRQEEKGNERREGEEGEESREETRGGNTSMLRVQSTLLSPHSPIHSYIQQALERNQETKRNRNSAMEGKGRKRISQLVILLSAPLCLSLCLSAYVSSASSQAPHPKLSRTDICPHAFVPQGSRASFSVSVSFSPTHPSKASKHVK
jgi:hypothetical protein